MIVIAVHQSVADSYRAAVGGAEQLSHVGVTSTARFSRGSLSRNAGPVHRHRSQRRASRRVIEVRGQANWHNRARIRYRPEHQYFHSMTLKQVYRISYPNGKIYVGKDVLWQ
jgi:hypothetical protein